MPFGLLMTTISAFSFETMGFIKAVELKSTAVSSTSHIGIAGRLVADLFSTQKIGQDDSQ